MRVAFLALALILPAASSALPAPPAAQAPQRLGGSATPARICPDGTEVRPIGLPEASKPRRLGELPPGDLTLTVLNRVGDCIEPVIVRQGIGGFDGGPGR